MDRKTAIEKLKMEKARCCMGCVHPQRVGYCKEDCRLPEAYDMAIEALMRMRGKEL